MRSGVTWPLIEAHRMRGLLSLHLIASAKCFMCYTVLDRILRPLHLLAMTKLAIFWSDFMCPRAQYLCRIVDKGSWSGIGVSLLQETPSCLHQKESGHSWVGVYTNDDYRHIYIDTARKITSLGFLTPCKKWSCILFSECNLPQKVKMAWRVCCL